MKITIYTTKTCPKCPKAKEVCRAIADEFGLEYLEKDITENYVEALQNQIATAPSIMLDENVLFRSAVPSREEMLIEIEKRKVSEGVKECGDE